MTHSASMNRLLAAIALSPLWISAQDPSPEITPYLQHQTAVAWRQDEQRLARLRAIRSEQDLRQFQNELRQKLLAMIGGLPETKTPLNPRITGRVDLDGYHI